MATSTTTQTATSLAANAGSLPRKPQNNPSLQKPKLTGWAQAAARSLPKSQQQQQPNQTSSSQQRNIQHPSNVAKSSSSTLTNSNSSTPSLRKSRKQTNGNNSNNNNGTNNNNANVNNNNNNANKPRQPYNREEVRNYMKDLFTQYTSSTSISTYNGLNSSRRGNNLDWGAVTNNRYRNKKYGSLNEIAQVLRN
ncbi:hypothetical protein ZYGR_0H01410 [Zygosaccharomyces rouxii]|uniref:ZYRO0B07282p n=2 Tax=Zygosaccharomyces rouxii TaxID=4956 RepID=C5DRC1_ZYGRC|nr:uncharacterized protein ZYRO0B07282g [Zygosaccharomyces rouxii]KAH9200126.1 hypothetical protein LQ764DRAFT_225032 [Zygosaccharomyces rouxii]GAV47300.1 hypothetical protein ZYGR_0H01410 [Zygosaccharomyces rouxii]CAR26332.1 ZYRO0B07282p [Zygosaccharomyces rouxii]